MNNPSGMSQAEIAALAGIFSPVGPDRSERRAMERRMGRPVRSASHVDDNKPTVRTSERRKKRKAQRRARAKNRR